MGLGEKTASRSILYLAHRLFTLGVRSAVRRARLVRYCDVPTDYIRAFVVWISFSKDENGLVSLARIKRKHNLVFIAQ